MTAIRRLIAEATERQMVLVVADTVPCGRAVVEPILADLVMVRDGVAGDYRIGDHHRVLVITPATEYRARGFTATAVLVDSHNAYQRLLRTLVPCLAASPCVRWFGSNGDETTEPTAG